MSEAQPEPATRRLPQSVRLSRPTGVPPCLRRSYGCLPHGLPGWPGHFGP